jgi:hypothetical protein
LVRSQASKIEQLNDELYSKKETEVISNGNKSVRDLMDIDEDAAVSDDRYEQLTNKQLIDVITKSVDRAIGNQKSSALHLIDNSLKSDRERVAKLEVATMRILAGLGVSEARRKFNDFDRYSDKIGNVMQKYPGIDFEDAYHLVKSKEASRVPSNDMMETEKPDSFASSRSDVRRSSVEKPAAVDESDEMSIISNRGRSREQSKVNESGIVGFRSLLDDAIDEVLG